jgi:hypothetical protein
MFEWTPGKIVLLEAIILGAIAGLIFGAYVEWQNWQQGSQHWINIPESYGILSLVVFGDVTIGLLLGYVALGIFVGLVIYVIGKRI